MRNLKRALSLALASVMVLGMMVVGAGAVSIDDFSDGEKIVNKEAVTVLTTLNVINGKDDGSYDPEGTVTRAELAKMICVILNGGKDPSLGNATTNTFTDTVGHWASPYIEYCTKLGIISGRGDGTFDPNGNVTGSEAAKMLLAASGYQAAIEGFTGANWEIATNVRANQVGLYDDVTIAPSAELNRDNAAQMVYNTLDIKVVTYKYTLTTDGSSVSSVPELQYKNATGIVNITVLEDKFGAIKVEGVVVGNEIADLSSVKTDKDMATQGDVIGTSLDAGKTQIAITNGDDQNEYAEGKEYVFTTSTGVDVLGRSVYLYVKPASTSQKSTVIGSVIASTDNKVVADYSSDSINDVADDNDLDVPSAAVIVKNYASATALTATAAKAAGTTGVEKLLIDNDDDGKVDYVLENTVQLGKVTKYSEKDDGSITVKLSNGNYTTDDKENVVGFEDVARDDVVLASFIGGKLYVEKAETVTGTIEAYKLNKTNATTNLTVDGTEYKVSFVSVYTDADVYAAKDETTKAMIDSDATFYVDAQGYLMARTEVEESAYDYAFVWGAEDGKNNVSTDRVKVTLQDGTTKTYDLDSKSDIDITNTNATSWMGRIFAYTLKDGVIKLSLPKGGAVETVSSTNHPDYTKGMTTLKTTAKTTAVAELIPSGVTASKIEGTTYYANNSSVFFYITMKDATTIDKVSVYNGRNNAPSVDGKQGSALIALNTKGDIGAVALTGTSMKESAGDHMFVYSSGYVTSDYVNVKAYLNDTVEPADVKVSLYNGSDVTNQTKVADGLYLYTKDSDGNYEIEEPDTSTGFYVKNEKVERTPYNTIVTNSGEFEITKTSVIIDNTNNPGTPDAVFGGSISKDDQVWLLCNDDDQILMAYYETPSTVTPPTGDPVPAGSFKAATWDAASGEFKLRYYNTPLTPAQVKTALAEALGEEIASYNSSTGEAKTAGGDVYLVDTTQIEMFKLSYNGTTIGYYDTGANLNTLKVTFTATATDVKLSDGATSAEYDDVAIGSDRKVTFTTGTTIGKNLDLRDAYAVTLTSVDAVVNDSAKTAITTTEYVAKGTEIIVTGQQTSGQNAIKAVAGSTTTLGESVTSSASTKATMTYTVESAVTFSEVATFTVLYNGDEIGTVEGGTMVTFTANFNQSNTNMKLLLNTKGGGAASTTGTLTQAGTTVSYVADDADDASNVIAFVDGAKVTLAGTGSTPTMKVGTDTVATGEFAAVGETLTVDAGAAKKVVSVKIDTTNVDLTDGIADATTGTRAVEFTVPAVSAHPIAVTVED